MTGLTNSRSVRILVLVTTTVLSVSGCHKWTTLDRPADLAMRDQPIGRAVITDTLGRQHVVEDLRLEEGVIHAYAPDQDILIAMPEREVSELEIRRSAPIRSLGLGLGLVTGLVVLVGALTFDEEPDDFGGALGCALFSCSE